MWPTLAETLRPHVAIYLRLALAAGFLTSVSDRFGLALLLGLRTRDVALASGVCYSACSGWV
jgi:hypothetical protein